MLFRSRSLGYPHAVARYLVGLLTTTTPSAVFERDPAGAKAPRSTRNLFHLPHLPQGAPTSPALANLAAFRLDTRLASLARKLGGAYTRYADDLAFSGDEAFAQKIGALLAAVRAIANDEGFSIHDKKTKIMRRGVRQSMLGLVVNERVAIDRRDYDRLKAILVNCARHGPESQNREHHRDFRAHLAGRVAFVESVDRRRGERLAEMLAKVKW